MKILCFAASNSQHSINRHLVSHASDLLVQQLATDCSIDLLDLNDYEMPIYSIDRENTAGIPAQAHRFFNQVRDADAILISFAEHNGSYTVAYKNLYDWASRIDPQVYHNKPVLLLATSPGPGGAKNVLKTAIEAFPHFGADVRGSFSLGRFHENFDINNKRFTNAADTNELLALIERLIDTDVEIA